MPSLGIFAKHCRTYNEAGQLAAAGSHLTKTIACISAAGLVIASAGFGAVFAYSVGIQHGPLLAGLTILMAAALELAKPLAVASAFTAFKSWGIVRGLLLSLLAATAIGYSLTAELQLVASSRGDLVAKREAAIESHDDRRESVKAARSELASLAPSRTVAEVQADVTKLLARNAQAPDCRTMDSPVARWACPKIAVLQGEIARAKRRTELQATISAATDTTKAPANVVKNADPGSAALATYLGTLGVNISATKLSDWLTLIPVLALEVGAALSLLLVQAVWGHASERPTAPHVYARSEHRTETRPGTPQSVPNPVEPAQSDDPNKPPKRTTKRAAKRTKRDAKKRLGNVVRLIHGKGGKVVASQQSMAKQLRCSKTRVNEMLRELEGAGVVKLKTSRQGTSVALVA